MCAKDWNKKHRCLRGSSNRPAKPSIGFSNFDTLLRSGLKKSISVGMERKSIFEMAFGWGIYNGSIEKGLTPNTLFKGDVKMDCSWDSNFGVIKSIQLTPHESHGIPSSPAVTFNVTGAPKQMFNTSSL
jgi:hypothetical protein